MKPRLNNPCCQVSLAAALSLCICCVVNAQLPVEAFPILQSESVETEADTDEDTSTVRFTFEGTPWRDVIRWIAEEADLALHLNEVPTGSFTYSDSSSFTHEGAIDRINLFLLPQGYSLVRSGKLLSVINLGDPRSMQQLDAIADLVRPDDLATRSNHDVVKCLFPLNELNADDAVQELSPLQLMTTPSVFEKTKQILVTDTVAKLKNVKAILDSFEPSELANGTVVKTFVLQHVDAEDVLVVARPHLGLAVGEMIGIDVSLSADLQGKFIFVTGIEDKVKLVEGLVKSLDIPQDNILDPQAGMSLQAHLVEGGNVEMVYNVLLTLLAGKPARLSMDESSSSVVAWGTPDVQNQIAETVKQLQAEDAEFAVIPLKTLDPYVAVSLLEELLDLSDAKMREQAGMDAFTRHGNTRGLELMKTNFTSDVPRIDADPVNRQLFVRAKKHQLAQIKNMVEQLDASAGPGSTRNIRIFPLSGSEAESVLETAAKFWQRPNPIMYYSGGNMMSTETLERVAADTDAKDEQLASMKVETVVPGMRLLTSLTQSQAPEIRCQLTSRGLLMQSEESEALDEFEDHLRTIVGPNGATPSPPVVFYLKYVKAADALKMLAELMYGGEAAAESDAGDLVNGLVSSSTLNTFSGSIVTSSDGTSTLMAGSITVVTDSRLNRLIVQGTSRDVTKIEDYLKIIDKDNSITLIETYGTANVIELFNTKATEVAAALREAFAGRIAGGSPAPGGVGNTGNAGAAEAMRAAAEAMAKAKDSRGDDSRDSNKGKTGKAQPQSTRNLEPQMTIAVHQPSNSLIVTAPQSLFLEVEKVAKLIDSRGQQSIEVVTPKNGAAFEAVLQQLLTGQNSNRSVSRGASPSTNQGRTSFTSPATARGKGDR